MTSQEFKPSITKVEKKIPDMEIMSRCLSRIGPSINQKRVGLDKKPLYFEVDVERNSSMYGLTGCKPLLPSKPRFW